MPTKILNKRAVLLTGTIIPNSVYTSYNNPQIRLKEYLFAIKFYKIHFKDDDIYFLENSEFDLSNNSDFLMLKQEINFSLLKYNKSERYNEGKGYQEFEMLDSAVESLKNNYNSFIKITGRYLISNAFELTNFNCKGIVVDLNTREKRADTYFLYFTQEFYTGYLKNEFKKVNDSAGIFIEHVVYNKIVYSNMLNYSNLFFKTPLLEGVTGSYGLTLKRNKLKVIIRDCGRFIYNLLGIKRFF